MTTSSSSSRAAAAHTWQSKQPTALGILFWFDALALAIGAAHILGNDAHRLAALTAYVILGATAVLVRVLPSIARRVRVRCLFDTMALLAFAFGMTWATGGVHSALLALLLLPLTAAAIALPRALYGLVAVCVVLSGLALGALTPGINVTGSAFIIWAISALAPMVIATTAIAVLIEQMQGAEQHIQDLSTVDSLTGLLNQRAFEEILAREHRKAERNGRPYCLVMIDVDNAQQLNQSLGHQAGNQLLSAVGAAVARSIRATDVAARFGDAQFAVLLAETDMDIATTIAQRLRSHVYAGTVSVGNRMLRANVNLGLAAYPKDRREHKEILMLADQRMRHDKELHRSAAQ
ncbi:MAG: GGDEF domain-containing protein [Candidatus Obscuribacterales bacterium]|nr:GGDEF domain-containing protein [Steroidobacteraceae bacterium]